MVLLWTGCGSKPKMMWTVTIGKDLVKFRFFSYFVSSLKSSSLSDRVINAIIL